MATIEITRAKGFHLVFDNGWTLSVQFGEYNYGTNYNLRDGEKLRPASEFETAAWHRDGRMVNWCTGTNEDGEDEYKDSVLGYVATSRLVDLMTFIKNLPDEPRTELTWVLKDLT